MKIGILQTGNSPDQIRGELGDYNELFEELLANRDFEFTTYPVLEHIFPNSVNDQEGWLITGSKFGAYEKLSWIPPLEDFLRQAYAAEVPIIGVCFGHQVLAQALGGKVEKFSDGWSVGAVDYDVSNWLSSAEEHDAKNITLMAWHQDQVTELPDGAEAIGSSDFCKNAVVSYGKRALTVQAHPEFTDGFFTGLLKARGEVLPESVASNAKKNAGAKLSSNTVADRFEAFFKDNKISHSAQKKGI